VKTCEIFIAINQDGDWIVTDDETSALETLSLEQGGHHARVVKVKVKVSPPVMAEAEIVIPDEAGQTVEVE
jgi:hypothetical protein